MPQDKSATKHLAKQAGGKRPFLTPRREYGSMFACGRHSRQKMKYRCKISRQTRFYIVKYFKKGTETRVYAPR